MAKKIQLTKNKFCIVDNEDYEYLNQWNWFYTDEYAARKPSKEESSNRKNWMMHRLIMKCPQDMQVDHINGNMLDNRKENLRICTPNQNRRNRSKNKRSSSNYKGVRKFRKKWRATINVNKKLIHLGTFNSEIEAAIAYNNAALKYFDNYAKLNKVDQANRGYKVKFNG